MTLTPEQFNLLATRAEHKNLEGKVDDLHGKADQIIDMLDVVTKKFENHDIEHVSNQAAHDRFEKRFKKLEAKVVTA